jgi:hypothetical protein
VVLGFGLYLCRAWWSRGGQERKNNKGRSSENRLIVTLVHV